MRPGESRDLDRIADIQARSPEAARWDPCGYLEYDFRVAAEGEAVAGFVVARRVAERESEILNLAVAPEYRRRGIGRQLLRTLLASHPGSVFLEVRASNAAACAFYQSAGFEPVGRRPGYYDSPLEDAVVMKLRSCYCQVGRRAWDRSRRHFET